MQTEFARAQMITQQIRAWDVLDERVLDAMRRTPREFFVPERYAELAFADAGIPLRAGQHMLAPKIVGRLLQALDAQPGMRALVVGAGTGFVPACLSAMGASVRAIEIHAELAAAARANLKRAGFGQVEVVTGDTFNLDIGKDYALIAVCGALPLYDDRFARALAVGGRLFVVDRRWAAAGSSAGYPHFRNRLEQPGPVRNLHRRARECDAPRAISVLRRTWKSMIREISVEELKARRDRGENPLVLDVREDWELQLARIPDVLHVPMNQLPARLGELSSDAETIVMCHAGGRSMRVAHFLASQGFTNVANLAGGISAWSQAVDATVPQY